MMSLADGLQVGESGKVELYSMHKHHGKGWTVTSARTVLVVQDDRADAIWKCRIWTKVLCHTIY